jgi:hypothetical protein
VIAALELLATLIAFIVFSPDWERNEADMIFVTGLTDNKRNSFVLNKLLSTKFPLTILLIELSEQLRTRDSVLNLAWVPRGENQEADDLTNEDFSKFSSNLRIEVNPAEIKWIVLPEIMKSSQELYSDIVSLKKLKRSRECNLVGSGKRRKRVQTLAPW